MTCETRVIKRVDQHQELTLHKSTCHGLPCRNRERYSAVHLRERCKTGSIPEHIWCIPGTRTGDCHYASRSMVDVPQQGRHIPEYDKPVGSTEHDGKWCCMCVCVRENACMIVIEMSKRSVRRSWKIPSTKNTNSSCTHLPLCFDCLGLFGRCRNRNLTGHAR